MSDPRVNYEAISQALLVTASRLAAAANDDERYAVVGGLAENQRLMAILMERHAANQPSTSHASSSLPFTSYHATTETENDDLPEDLDLNESLTEGEHESVMMAASSRLSQMLRTIDANMELRLTRRTGRPQAVDHNNRGPYVHYDVVLGRPRRPAAAPIDDYLRPHDLYRQLAVKAMEFRVPLRCKVSLVIQFLKKETDREQRDSIWTEIRRRPDVLEGVEQYAREHPDENLV